MLRLLHNITSMQQTSLLESSRYRNVGKSYNQSHTEQWGGHYASFVAMPHSLRIVSDE